MRISSLISLLVGASMLSFATPPIEVKAQSLGELLFGNRDRRYRNVRRPLSRRYYRDDREYYDTRDYYDRRRARVERRRRAEKDAARRIATKSRPKVKGPKYYNYKPAALARVKFAGLAKQYAKSGYYGPQLADVDTTSLLFAEASARLGKFEIKAQKNISKAVLNHYKNHSGFLWVENNAPSASALRLIDVLNSADQYGLEKRDYFVELASSSVPQTTPSSVENETDDELYAMISFEITLSLRAVRYGLDANGGRVNPNKISGYHDLPRKKLKAKDIIAEFHKRSIEIENFARSSQAAPVTIEPVSVDGATVDTQQAESAVLKQNSTLEQTQPERQKPKDAVDYLLSLHPVHPVFSALKSELAVLRDSVDDAVVVAPDTFVRPGKSHVEMPNIIKAIKKRGSSGLLETHAELLTGYDGGEIYSEELVALVQDFQKENKLKPDGIIGPRTVSKMSDMPVATKINRVVLAMERLRWHPKNFGKRHVFVNQPAYRANYIVNDKVNLSMKIIVGKPANQSSFFHDTIERVVYNPYWGVPRSILVNEMLPKLRRNPSYLDQRGYEVTTGSGQQISSASVDWYSVGANFGYNVRQTPGPKNALGELKILFPNKHNIYMHDTPARGLFKRSRRALSHGCIRLHRPREMAAAVLGTSVKSVRNRLGAGHNTQNLKRKVPVYVAYFTAWTNRKGNVQYFGDIYGRDKQLLKALKKTGAMRNPVDA